MARTAMELPGTMERSIREANDLMEVSREQLEVMRRQADEALEQAERMNELLGRVVRLTEPLERAQRGGEFVGERLKRALFGPEEAARASIDAEVIAEESRPRGATRRQPWGRKRRPSAAPGSIAGAVSRPEAGLCDRCRHQRLIHNTRGSVFSLCERSRTDPTSPATPGYPCKAAAVFRSGRWVMADRSEMRTGIRKAAGSAILLVLAALALAACGSGDETHDNGHAPRPSRLRPPTSWPSSATQVASDLDVGETCSAAIAADDLQRPPSEQSDLPADIRPGVDEVVD